MSTTQITDSTQQTASAGGWRVVAAREVSVKLRDKTFLLSTAFMLVLIVVSIAFSAFIAGRHESRTVAVLDPAAQQLVQQAGDQGQDAGSDLRLQARTADGQDQVETWLESGEADAALLQVSDPGNGPRWEVVGQREVDAGLQNLLADAVSASELASNAQAAGTTSGEILTGTTLGQRVLEEGGLDPGVRYGLSFAFAFLFYITALVFGLSIAQSVIEEKQSRVVEILAAAVPIRQLLAGKVIGNSVLAIGQVVLLASVGLIGLSLSGQGEVLALVLGASVWFVVFFLLGFAALACIWAVAGSIATRQEELQATTMPVQAVVFVALFIGIAGTGKLLTVASFVPLVSSVAMPVRMLSGNVPLWQPAVAAVLVAVVAVVLVRLGARLYEGSLLRTNRRTKLREAFERDAA
jgi:ABC-2 type transport system permease protein